MKVFIVIFTILFLQEEPPFTKLVYELTGHFSGGQVTNVTLLQYYDDEGQMVLGGYAHKIKPQETSSSSGIPDPESADLDSEDVKKQLREAGLTAEQIGTIRSGLNFDSRTNFMREYEEAKELFMTTNDSVYDIRVGMDENEVLGFPRSLLQWDLHDEIREINGYQCQMATINYFGRKFTAWFTSEIPINAGPYLFSGLPGAIVELNDDYGVYTYSLLEVVRSEPPADIAFPDTKKILNHKEALSKQWIAVQRYLNDITGSEQRIQRMLSRQLPGIPSSSTQSNSQSPVFNAHEHFLEWTILDDVLGQ